MDARQIGLMALALVALGGGSVTAQTSSADQILPSQQLLSRFGLERLWWGQGVLNPSRDRVLFLHVDEDSIYVQSNSGLITAFEAETGQRRWAVHLGQYDPPSFRVVTNEEIAMVVAGSHLYGLDKFSGKTLWRLRLPGPASTSPIADDTQVYIGMLDGSVYAFNLKKIYKLHQEGRLPEWSFDAMTWRFKSSAEITSPPVLFDARLCIANRNGDVYGVTTLQRELVFQFETSSRILAPISRVEDLLFVAAESNYFYALRVRPRPELVTAEGTTTRRVRSPLIKRDRESGKVAWEFVSGLPIRKAPIGIGPDVFILPERGGFYCLASQTGTQKWWQPQAANFVAATAKTVYASDADHNLVMLSRQDGDVVGNLPLRRFSIRLPNDRTDRIVMATSSGLVLVLREKGRTVPTFHMFPDRLPLMPEFESEDGEAPREKPAAEAAPTESAPEEKEAQ